MSQEFKKRVSYENQLEEIKNLWLDCREDSIDSGMLRKQNIKVKSPKKIPTDLSKIEEIIKLNFDVSPIEWDYPYLMRDIEEEMKREKDTQLKLEWESGKLLDCLVTAAPYMIATGALTFGGGYYIGGPFLGFVCGYPLTFLSSIFIASVNERYSSDFFTKEAYKNAGKSFMHIEYKKLLLFPETFKVSLDYPSIGKGETPFDFCNLITKSLDKCD